MSISTIHRIHWLEDKLCELENKRDLSAKEELLMEEIQLEIDTLQRQLDTEEEEVVDPHQAALETSVNDLLSIPEDFYKESPDNQDTETTRFTVYHMS